MLAALQKEYLIKNMNCDGCLEAPASCVLRHLEGGGEEDQIHRKLPHTANPTDAVNVDFGMCDRTDETEIWNLLSLEKSQTWYRFENEECDECMTLTYCDSFSNVIMAPCDDTDPYQVWGYVGGNIVPWECYVNQATGGDTPDLLLEANCPTWTPANSGGTYDPSTTFPTDQFVDLDSFSSDSDDFADAFWMLIPVKFSGSTDEIFD